ncbi:MAG: DHH family phosphoesterase [Candidatus Hydrogenedentes bacterium]|nr:DHH family phosphoesterase [Candidatus Hydrogenedentota bacterium]
MPAARAESNQDGLDLGRSAANVEALLRICSRRGRILILMQNNPDPDAIASAAAVRDLIHRRLNRRAVIGYGGVFGRAENRAMVHELRIEARHVKPEDLARYKTLCLVDTQPRSGNNALYTARPADIVIDHHLPPKKSLWQAQLADIRPDYGATSTILYEYLVAADVKPHPLVATALYYGIESDTQELGRDVCPADIAAFRALVALAETKRLARIRRAPSPPGYFARLHEALGNAVVAGTAVITLIRNSDNPDIFAEVAEMMLRLEAVRTSVAYGPFEGVVHLSARAPDARGNMAARMKRVVSRLGTGGGHRSMAGGQIPVGSDLEKRLHLIHRRIIKHFASGRPCRPLLAARRDAARAAGGDTQPAPQSVW